VDGKCAIRAVTVVDVLDRVLDNGIVIDANVKVAVVGLDVLTVETKVVVTSVETRLSYGEHAPFALPSAQPPLSTQ
jgi:hypothetical protein